MIGQFLELFVICGLFLLDGNTVHNNGNITFIGSQCVQIARYLAERGRQANDIPTAQKHQSQKQSIHPNYY